MQVPMATLLLVTSAVILTCVVVDYAVVTVEQTLQNPNLPQLDRLRALEASLLNQTDSLFSQTQPVPQDTPVP